MGSVNDSVEIKFETAVDENIAEDAERSSVAPVAVEDDPDDCIIIPQNIEVIDLTADDNDDPTPQPSQQSTALIQHRPFEAVRRIIVVPRRPPPPTPAAVPVAPPEGSVSMTCSICLESPVERRAVALSCGHIFCKECIDRALRNNRECPYCKRRAPARNATIQLYFQ